MHIPPQLLFQPPKTTPTHRPLTQQTTPKINSNKHPDSSKKTPKMPFQIILIKSIYLILILHNINPLKAQVPHNKDPHAPQILHKNLNILNSNKHKHQHPIKSINIQDKNFIKLFLY